jgi:acetyl esterase/lipase
MSLVFFFFAGLHQFGGPPPQTAIPNGVAVLKDLKYVQNGSASQKLDLYLPPNGSNRPLVILIHGGAFMFGDKGGEDVGLWLKEGFAVASLNYRLSGEARFPAAIEDCKSAIRWLRFHAKEYRFDPHRFGVFGASAGGNLAAMIGATGETRKFDRGTLLKVSSRVSVVGDWFGPTDFLRMDGQRYAGGDLHDPADSPESRYLGGPIQQRREMAEESNPLTYVSAKCPPFYIAHGDEDKQVPYGQSLLLKNALERAKVTVKFRTVHGQGHMFRDSVATQETVEFFNLYLRPPGKSK